MSTKLKDLKEKRGLLIPQARAASDALTADPTNAEKQKAWNDRSAEITALNAEIAREERMAELENLNPDNRSGLPGGTPPGGTKPGEDPLKLAQDEAPDDPTLNPDKHGYSLLRAVRMQIGAEPFKGVEAEVHQELKLRKESSGLTCRGIMVPHTLRMTPSVERRGTIIDVTAGAGAIPAIQSVTMIDAVRNMVVLRQLGAIVLTDMVGTFSIPKKTATTAFEWKAEGVAATGSDITIGSVPFAMKNLTGWTRLSRSFVKQTSQDAEQMVRNDFAEGLAVGMDNGGINGTGSADDPTGLLNLPGVAVVAGGASGLALNWANTVKMETEVDAVNTLFGSLAYLTNSKVRGQAKTTAKDSGSGIFIWQGNEVNGYPAAVSNSMPSNKVKGSSGAVCSTMLFGNFADAVFALWGGVDIVVDAASEAKQGNIVLVAHQSADFNVRRAASFSKNVDILA